jgi:hypothetical protein
MENLEKINIFLGEMLVGKDGLVFKLIDFTELYQKEFLYVGLFLIGFILCGFIMIASRPNRHTNHTEETYVENETRNETETEKVRNKTPIENLDVSNARAISVREGKF